MTLQIKLFAAAAQLADADQLTVTCQFPLTLQQLRDQILQQNPALADIIPFCRIAVDHEFANEDCSISATSEVALIPPVSGG